MQGASLPTNIPAHHGPGFRLRFVVGLVAAALAVLALPTWAEPVGEGLAEDAILEDQAEGIDRESDAVGEETDPGKVTTVVLKVSDLAPREDDPLATDDDLRRLPVIVAAAARTWPPEMQPEAVSIASGELEVRGSPSAIAMVTQLIEAVLSAERERQQGKAAIRVISIDVQLPLPEDAEEPEFKLVLYAVDGLLGEGANVEDRLQLERMVTCLTAPTSWDLVGGRGSLRAWRGVLAVMQTREVHQELEEVLEMLTRAKQLEHEWNHRTGPLPDPEPLPLQVLHTSPEDEVIFAALDRKADFQYTEAPLEEVAEAISLNFGIPVTLDERDLEDAGLGTDLPMSSCDLEDITLRSALRIMLYEYDLTYTVRDGSLVITVPQEVEFIPQLILYPSYDLLGDDASMVELCNVFTAIAVPTEWDEVGGIGSMDSWCGSLVIAQSPWGHDECEQLWRTLRAARQLMNDWDSITPLPTTLELVVAADQPDFALRQALKQEINLPTEQLSLAELPQFLKDQFGCQAVFDSLYFSYDDIELDAAIALGGQGKLADVLREDLEPLDLTFEVWNEVVWITKQEPPSAWGCTIQAYPVFDLTAVPHEEGQEQTYDAARLRELLLHLETNLSPNSWSGEGGVGELTHLGPGILVVNQTSDVHQQIEAYFEGVRAAEDEAAP